MQETPSAAAAATELLVSGMSCNNCARHVTEAIQSVPGVRSATVLLDTGRASVRWNPGALQDTSRRHRGRSKRPVTRPGKSRPTADAGGSKPEHKNWQINLWLGVVVTAALMAGEWSFDLALKPWFQWLSFALAGMVQIFAGAKFYRGAWNQLQIGSSNMDTLVALGSTTAFGYSAWALFGGAGGHLYFMEAAAIITLISFGHWLEARVSARASGALEKLLNLAPQTARRILIGAATCSSLTSIRNAPLVGCCEEVEVPVAELKIGDLVALRPGDRVPVDGLVLKAIRPWTRRCSPANPFRWTKKPAANFIPAR